MSAIMADKIMPSRQLQAAACGPLSYPPVHSTTGQSATCQTPRALSGTEEALARLSAGRLGGCEQCAAAIPVSQLVQFPEIRYCVPCIQLPAGPGHPAVLTAAAT
jgi:hypothetical protein